ncbi:MAG TPA: metallophosphoesterase [Bryobacteraceae bacterium]|jgi:Icc-related predicted phosphoesterase|nr:metallophosphoesterase [Bryobacteraceae bacterium]
MRLLIFSDIHADYAALEKLMAIEADLYFAAGDLVNWNRNLDRIGPILARRADKMYVIPGNHESEDTTAELCREFKLHHFHGGRIEAGGFQVAGSGYSNPTPFDTPGEYSEDEIARGLEPFAKFSPLILICHCPPKDTPLDQVREGTHAGSTAVRDFIERVQPEYFFCGHIHEAAGTEAMLGKTRGRNVGKKGFVLEI